jgi:pilus assembly protein CpaE
MVRHRILLAGINADAGPATAQALRGRTLQPPVSHAGAEEALADALAHSGEMHLIITGPDALSGVAGLTAGLPGQPVLALLPEGAGMPMVLAAQRAGAAQVVALPLVADDFLAAVDCIVRQFPVPVQEGRLIAVCGVTGGCGATTLALALAQELGARSGPGRPGCLLVELPSRLGALATYLAIEPRVTSRELLSDPTRLTPQGLRQALSSVSPGLDVLAGPYQELTPGSVPPRSVSRLVEAARALAASVVLDLPCTFDEHLFETLAVADRVLLVGTQTVASVRALQMVRDLLVREEGLQGLELVINRYDPSLAEFQANRLAQVLGVPKLWTVAADYPAVMAAANHGKPLREAAPHSPVVFDVHRLAGALLGTPALLAATAKLPAAPARTVRVLHIEDDAIQREVVAIHLARMKGVRCSVVSAANEEQGMELYRSERPDLVILDYHLAQGDGMSCLKKLRALDPLLPVLMVSGLSEPGVASQLLEAGADDFLSKENMAGDRLSRAVTAALERAGGVRARRGPVGPEEELRDLTGDLRRAIAPGRFGVGTIQRLSDQTCDELETAAPGAALPRRTVLGLFLRLFGREER